MTWRLWLTDARTGLMVRPLDVPSFSWTMTVGSFGFSTTSKDLGEEDASSLTVPFSQLDEYGPDGSLVHRATPAEIDSVLGMGRRALTVCWDYEGCSDPRGIPLMWGVLGEREDHWLDTTFPLYSPMDLLANRYAVRDGDFRDGITYYTHVAYADNPDGSNDDGSPLSHSLGSHVYIGVAVDTNATAPTSASKYAWSHIKGVDKSIGTKAGKDSSGRQLYLHKAWADAVDNNYGVPSGRDRQGRTLYKHTAYATSGDGKSGFSTTDPTGRTYVGTYTDTVRADSKKYASYTWSSYSSSSGSTGFSTTVSADKTYFGTLTDTNLSDSRSHADYSWTSWSDGEAGNGYPASGKVGGQTPYLHIAFSTAKDGSTRFSTINDADRSWVGVYVDYSQEDSTDASSYRWYASRAKAGLASTAGQGPNGSSTNARASVMFSGLSNRALACELIRLGVSRKNGGTLPINLPYLGEMGSSGGTYAAWNVQNLAVKTLLTDLANSDGGPDMTFRPRWSDSSHVVVDFLAGSDGDVYLGATSRHPTLIASPYGGTLEVTSLSWALPVQRWYGTGAGADASVTTALAEDLSQVTSSTDPPILRESAYGDTDLATVTALKARVTSLLSAQRLPLAQLTGTVHADDAGPDGRTLRPLGSFWPGERVDVDLTGFRTLPDGRYEMRIMSMSGDESDAVTVVFDVFSPGF